MIIKWEPLSPLESSLLKNRHWRSGELIQDYASFLGTSSDSFTRPLSSVRLIAIRHWACGLPAIADGLSY